MSAHDAIAQLSEQMGRSIIGQGSVIERLVIGLLANGNLLTTTGDGVHEIDRINILQAALLAMKMRSRDADNPLFLAVSMEHFRSESKPARKDKDLVPHARKPCGRSVRGGVANMPQPQPV